MSALKGAQAHPRSKRTILRSQETGTWLQTPPSYDASLKLASLKWNLEMYCIFDIVEHHPISSACYHIRRTTTKSLKFEEKCYEKIIKYLPLVETTVRKKSHVSDISDFLCSRVYLPQRKDSNSNSNDTHCHQVTRLPTSTI